MLSASVLPENIQKTDFYSEGLDKVERDIQKRFIE